MNAPADPPVWLLLLGVIAGMVMVVALFVVLRHYTLKFLRWLGGEFVAIAPAPLAEAGRWVGRGLHLIYVAALLCGGTSLGFAVLMWRGALFPDWSDPLFLNPLFWLTWLAVMAAIMMLGVVGAALMRTAVAFAIAKLRKVPRS